MKIRRTLLAAAVIGSAAAPIAQAAPAVDPVPATPAVQTVDTTRFAEMAAHREAIANRQWERAGNVPVVTLTRADDGGFDTPSAVLGGTVPLILLAAGLLGWPAISRRRNQRSAAIA